MKLITIQKEHFDNHHYRYDVRKIYEPPVHTKLEINKLLGLIPNNVKKVVDFGSGNGRLTIPLLANGYNVTAVDISRKSLFQLRKIAKKYNYIIRTKNSIEGVVNCSAIVGCDILHHVDLEPELAKIYSSLRKDGIVIFSEPNALNPVWYLYFIFKGIMKIERSIIYMTYLNLRSVLNAKGYKNIAISGLGLFPRSIFKNNILCALNDSLGNLPLIKLFAYRLIIMARKN